MFVFYLWWLPTPSLFVNTHLPPPWDSFTMLHNPCSTCPLHLLSEWISLSRVALAWEGRRGNSSLTMYCVSISSWHLNWQNRWCRWLRRVCISMWSVKLVPWSCKEGRNLIASQLWCFLTSSSMSLTSCFMCPWGRRNTSRSSGMVLGMAVRGCWVPSSWLHMLQYNDSDTACVTQQLVYICVPTTPPSGGHVRNDLWTLYPSALQHGIGIVNEVLFCELCCEALKVYTEWRTL